MASKISVTLTHHETRQWVKPLFPTRQRYGAKHFGLANRISIYFSASTLQAANNNSDDDDDDDNAVSVDSPTFRIVWKTSGSLIVKARP
jgi:hypothetical protein